MYKSAQGLANRPDLDFCQEKRRQAFIRRARKEKKRWFYLALKYADKKRIGKRRAGSGWGRFAWLAFGGAALGASWLIWQSGGMGEARRTEDREVFWDIEGFQERELFGIRIQFNKGQITIFREKEEVTGSSESKELRK